LASGVLRRIWQAAPAAFWLAMFPLVVCALSIGAGLLLATTLLAATGLTSIGTAAASGLVIGALAWRLVARRVDSEWMLRLSAFMRQHAIGELPVLDARLDEMAVRLVEAVEARMRQPAAAPLKEVMVMGYSSGSILAANVLARALPRLTEVLAGRRATKATSLSMVTLGQCIPIAAEWPEARPLRAALDVLAESPLLTWHDYSSASDAAAFAQTPPWPQPARLRGFQGSPAFKAPRNPLKGMTSRRGRDAHLQYLQPPRADDSSGYDFFAVVCGPQTLEERHAHAAAMADLLAKVVA
jgi:hypothetical protein